MFYFSVAIPNGFGTSPLTPSARISALNIVGDLLRKVGVSIQLFITRCFNCKGIELFLNLKSGKKKGHLPVVKAVIKLRSKSIQWSAEASPDNHLQGLGFLVSLQKAQRADLSFHWEFCVFPMPVSKRPQALHFFLKYFLLYVFFFF